jgi:hypothetical protein
MSIVVRGHCDSCGRMSTLVDQTNYWCEKCIDPDHRRRCDRNKLILSCFWSLVFVGFIMVVIWGSR